MIKGLLQEIQEHMDTQLCRMMKSAEDKNEGFSKETEILEKNWTEILEMKNSVRHWNALIADLIK